MLPLVLPLALNKDNFMGSQSIEGLNDPKRAKI